MIGLGGVRGAAGMDASTIVGVATGSPDGGVAIVRISGPMAFALARDLTQRELGAARRLVRRDMLLATGVEAALVVAMPAPHSFTGEDVVEFHVHGGALNVEDVVEALLRRGGVAAVAGDFSRRAFAHGRLSLEACEGLAAVIGAKTAAGLALARRLSAGELGRAVESVLERLRVIHVFVTAALDFPDDVEEGDARAQAKDLGEVRDLLGDWLRRFEAGRRQRSVPRVVLAGPPNAGKSALFNALLGQRRAIVAERAGTTRDYLEAELRLGAVCCHLVDTAGLRDAADEIEQDGVDRSLEQIDGADLVVWVEAADAEAVIDNVPTGEHVLRVENKRDLGQQRPWLGVSAQSGLGLDAVREWLAAWFRAGGVEPWVGLRRHRDCAELAGAALERAQSGLDGAVALELVAFELEVAIVELEKIRGRTATGAVGAEVLDAIFSQFCIGK